MTYFEKESGKELYVPCSYEKYIEVAVHVGETKSYATY
jgi:hypothetical protein